MCSSDLVSVALKADDGCYPEPAVPYFFCEEKNGRPGQSVSHSELEAFCDMLDQAFLSRDPEALFLTEDTPYPKLVMGSIWASSRGISIAFGRLADQAEHRAMEFGLFHFGSYRESADDKYGSLFDTVQFADKNGFGCVWTPERHFNEFGGLFPNPSVLSAALAVTTSRVQIRCEIGRAHV